MKISFWKQKVELETPNFREKHSWAGLQKPPYRKVENFFSMFKKKTEFKNMGFESAECHSTHWLAIMKTPSFALIKVKRIWSWILSIALIHITCIYCANSHTCMYVLVLRFHMWPGNLVPNHARQEWGPCVFPFMWKGEGFVPCKWHMQKRGTLNCSITFYL